jgi:hypothetical protein
LPQLVIQPVGAVMTVLSAVFSPEALRTDEVAAPMGPVGYTTHRGASPVPDRLIGYHNFTYPKARFRVSILSGCALSRPAAHLVEGAYSRLGYVFGASEPIAADDDHNGASLEAVHDGRMLGTLSVTLDSDPGLKAEHLYPSEIAPFRARGGVCEFTRLALDTSLAGREVLCSLFYVAYVYAHLVHRNNHLFVEVNPRHASFYQRMLGFERLGPERICPRVNAPAVLLRLDMAFTRQQIDLARGGFAVTSTTLYRYAPPVAEEQILLSRIAESGNR